MMKRFKIFLARQWPLIGFVLPVLFIGFHLANVYNCTAIFNEYTLGLAGTMAGASGTYWIDRKLAAKRAMRHA